MGALQLLASAGRPLETILTAIGMGGDVDTAAAMAGAIAGARLGPAAVPNDLASGIHDRGTWKAGDLARLACEAAHVASGPRAGNAEIAF
jgi:ADP-ribosylglycohydrolase